MNPEDEMELRRRLRKGRVGELLDGDPFEFSIDAVSDEESELKDNSYDFDEFSGVSRDSVAPSPDQVHNAGVPFDELAKKMTDVTPDGKIKKLVVEIGTDPVPPKSRVNMHYNFFLENSKMPFDSTYLRLGKPERVVIGHSGNVAGFDVAAMSMKVGERSQFLVHHDFAFKEMGSPPRIPKCATILMDIHILNAVPCNDSLEEPEEPPKNFDEAVKLAMQYRQNGKDTFLRGQISVAIKNYIQAEKILLRCYACNEDDQEREEACKKQLLLLYTNLSVCYNHPKKNDARTVLKCCSKAFNVDEVGASQNAKLLFNRAVAHCNLGDYDQALKDLTAAWNLEPNNDIVNKKMEEVNNMKKKNLEQEQNFMTRAFGLATISNNETKPLGLDRKFKEDMRETLEQFCRSDGNSMALPPNYTNDERLFFQSECSRLGLVYEERMMARKLRSIVFKKC